MTLDSKMMVACPTCKIKVVYSPENAFRPFCSERCKLLDLGAWADEQYCIPIQQTISDDANALKQGDSYSSEDDDSV